MNSYNLLKTTDTAQFASVLIRLREVAIKRSNEIIDAITKLPTPPPTTNARRTSKRPASHGSDGSDRSVRSPKRSRRSVGKDKPMELSPGVGSDRQIAEEDTAGTGDGITEARDVESLEVMDQLTAVERLLSTAFLSQSVTSHRVSSPSRASVTMYSSPPQIWTPRPRSSETPATNSESQEKYIPSSVNMEVSIERESMDVHPVGMEFHNLKYEDHDYDSDMTPEEKMWTEVMTVHAATRREEQSAREVEGQNVEVGFFIILFADNDRNR